MASSGTVDHENVERVLPHAVFRAQRRSKIEDRSAGRRLEELKQQVARLESELVQAKSSALESFIPPVLCKCYTDCFSGTRENPTTPSCSFNENSVSRFLDSVRVLNGRKRRRVFSESNEVEDEQAAAHVGEIAEFIVELISGMNMNGKLLTVWLHQAVEFVKGAVVLLVVDSKPHPVANSTLKKLIGSLTSKLIGFDAGKNEVDYRPCIERVLLQLSEVSFLGQKLLVELTSQLGILSETLAQADPFGIGSAQLLENSFFLLHSLSEIVEKSLSSWAREGKLDPGMLEAFISTFFQMKSAMVGTRLNLLFVNYTDRVCAQLVKQLHAVASRGNEELQLVVTGGLQRLVDLATREFQR